MSVLDRKFTIAELADRWGWSRSKLYRLVYAHEIPYVRIGSGRGGIYFEESVVEQWLEARRRRPTALAQHGARSRAEERAALGIDPTRIQLGG